MKEPKCAQCPQKYCYQGITDENKLPDFCPMIHFKSLIQSVSEKYKDQKIHDFFVKSAVTEREAYDEHAARELGKSIPVRPRIREISEFAKKIKAAKVGMAFCIGLEEEAKRASAILESRGLKVCSAVCSCGAVDKTELGVPAEQKIRSPEHFEASCNPILQAEILNRLQTDFNIIVGLCIGHDMLFTKFCRAPVTTLVVKDRFTGHNPAITLYSRYHRDLV
ncbi:MAG: DUF1847 domain-containing protein [Candidatus Aminicenantes bacterium]|nr:DUF1847 domain-containing protein [Candidatus Aminicenantes bacterium]